ncbi:16S rRNA (cytidine1402-2'-O)-methyltransferase [Natronospira proteinivora]|uniref:Ribosomal RNA small subunit methyltransferase I n=1 Tax=Natronospira proteinivora TaxID=1807133 RepID=A0ABT1G467_9GAMM|nr:16S rRNA (cytidine1402-2'-O)-methyltransferase [Natronospira proteinivora]
MQQSGTLYIVATPIGNLDDASPRLKTVLSRVDAIACEDTRHSGRFLQHLGIQKPLLSLHEHNEDQRLPALLGRLQGGESLALISDAGTPLLSDPGYPLVRAAVAAGIPLSPIPGPNAAIAALSVSGLPPEPFRFLGFPPRQGGARRKWFQTLAKVPDTLLFYESIHRLGATLADLAEAMGGERPAMVGRELTKRHEQLRHGSLDSLAEWAATASEAKKGEAVIVVGGWSGAPSEEASLDVDALLKALDAELPPRKVATVAAQVTGLNKNALYQRLMERRQD